MTAWELTKLSTRVEETKQDLMYLVLRLRSGVKNALTKTFSKVVVCCQNLVASLLKAKG